MLLIHNRFKFIFIHIILPIIIGGLIYVLFRDRKLLMFVWFDFLGLGDFVDFLRRHVYEYRRYLPSSILFSFPDAMWVYSFTMFLSIYFRNWIILLIPSVGSILLEICQIWFVPGTYDIIDNVYMLLFTLLAFYLISRERKKAQNYEVTEMFKLHYLMKKGIITKEEYKQEKRKLLKKL